MTVTVTVTVNTEKCTVNSGKHCNEVSIVRCDDVSNVNKHSATEIKK